MQNIKPNTEYTVSEASRILNVSTRTLNRLAVKEGVKKVGKKYIFQGSILLKNYQTNGGLIISPLADKVMADNTEIEKYVEKIAVLGKPLEPFKTTNKTEIKEKPPEVSYEEQLKKAIELVTIAAAKQNVQHKIFTEDEYVNLIATFDRVEHQEEQIQYLRKRVERQDEILTNLFKTIEQRNYIEAKGLTKE